MQFKVGDKAVYPAHGVAEIKGVEARKVGGNTLDCYVLNIVSSGATLIVPVAASNKAGMRDLISSEEIDQVFKVIQEPSRNSAGTWNRRFREFNDKLRSGSTYEIAKVFRDLWNLQSHKDLSYGEKQMLEKSRGLVVSEISASRGIAPADVEVELDEILAPTGS